MNVLILTNYFPPEIGGASHLFFELSESLARNSHRVTVVTGFPRYNIQERPERYKAKFFFREKMEGIHIIRLATISLPKGNLIARGLEHFFTPFILFIGGLFSKRQDIIIVYSPPLPLGLSAYFLSKIKRIPFVVNIQDLFPQEVINLGLLKNHFLIALFESIEKFVYKKANYLTVHSVGNRQHVISKGSNSTI